MDKFSAFDITDISAPAADACCGADGCCTPTGSAEAPGAASATAAGVAETTVLVDGMTCSHCVSAVSKELGSIEGVEDIEVALVPGGASTVRIASSAPLSAEAIAAAIDAAGYSITQ